MQTESAATDGRWNSRNSILRGCYKLPRATDWMGTEELNYAERLQEGRSIGSGQVEGACKNLIGRRLKQAAARWRVRRLNRMARLCSIMYSQQWIE